MRAAAIAAAMVAFTAGAAARGEAFVAPALARDGDGLGTGVVVTPAARSRGFVVPAVPSDAVRFPDGVIGIRFGSTLVVGTPLEAAGAWTWLSARRSHVWRLFRTIGDLDLRDASRRDVAWVGADAGKPLQVAEDGWTIVCWTCDAAEVVAGLEGLGARGMAPWAWQRMKASRPRGLARPGSGR